MRKIHINNDDNYATPPEFYEALNKRFNFDFDPCPYCEGEVVDGLSIEWGNSNFINYFWDNDIFCNFVEWKKLNALVVEKKNQQINLQSVQIERGDSSLVVRNVNLRKVEKELKTIDNQSISSQKNIDYYPLVLQDVQNARLSNHLIKLILLLNQDVNQDLGHIVGLANVNTQKKLWQENVTILKQKILLRIQKLNIENLIKEEKGHRKRSAVRNHLYRGNTFEWTYEQWERCKLYFGNKCAYCESEKFLTQDHFIPLSNNTCIGTVEKKHCASLC